MDQPVTQVDGWAFSGAPPSAAGATLTTLVDGSSFCVSTPSGNILPGAAMGLFVRDTRILSQWVLEAEGAGLEPLTVSCGDAFGATFVTRSRPAFGRSDSTVLVVRERVVGDGMRERLTVTNLGRETAGLSLELRVAADFADLFEVKEGRVRLPHELSSVATERGLELEDPWSDPPRGMRFELVERGGGVATSVVRILPGDDRSPAKVHWELAVPPRAVWTCGLVVHALVDGRPLTGPEEFGEHIEETPAARRAREWRMKAPVLETADDDLARTLARTVEDVGALRIFDPAHPDRAVIAAGAPWFMALFGRDSLLTSWMVLPLDTRLALGTLRALAEAQGSVVDPLTEEEPGRVLHEMRLGRSTSPARGGAHVYYGSADATPLFVMLLGELRRWGLGAGDVESLLPHADRALDWMRTYGDRDGDGFIEYQRATDRGLRNQGWKDSFDGVSFADGRLAEPPIALAEVQGYAYAAYLARAHFAREADDIELCLLWADRAAELKAQFNERFWIAERGWFALGLDKDKRPIDSLASNMGHCLWTGIIDEDKAPTVVEHLLSPDMFSGWGVRTLASSMGAYNPMSYHNGSVWPHDNALIAAGLMRYGFVTEAQRVVEGILGAAAHFSGRLPELFCGFDRAEFPLPVPYPTSCSPQAWSAAAPLLLLRTLLRFDPSVSVGELRVAPEVPLHYLPLRVANVGLGGDQAAIEVTRDGFSLQGISPGLTVVRSPRPVISPLVGTT